MVNFFMVVSKHSVSIHIRGLPGAFCQKLRVVWLLFAEPLCLNHPNLYPQKKHWPTAVNPNELPAA